MTKRDDQRPQDREFVRHLRQQVIAWDPIGLLADGAPEGEYDCLLGTLVRGLRGAQALDELAQLLGDRLSRDFGVKPPADLHCFAAGLIAWYEEEQSASV